MFICAVDADNESEGRPPLRYLILSIRAFKRKAKAERDSVDSENDDDADIEEMDEEEAEASHPTVGVKRPRAPGSSRVVQVEIASGQVIRIHPTKEAAAAAVGGLETFISTCLSGVVDEAYGFGWRYPTAEEEEEEELEAAQRAEERLQSVAQESSDINQHTDRDEALQVGNTEVGMGPDKDPDVLPLNSGGDLMERIEHNKAEDIEWIETENQDTFQNSPDVIMEDDLLEDLMSG